MGTKITYSDKDLTDALLRFYKEFGRVPEYRDLNKRDGYPSGSTYQRRFISLNNALQAAGLEIVNTKGGSEKKYSDQELIDAIKRFHEEHGRQPYYKDLGNKNGFPSPIIYQIRFGSWSNALEAAGFATQFKRKDHNKMSPILQLYKDDIRDYKSPITVQNRIATLYDLDAYLKSKSLEWNDLTAEICVEWFKILSEKGCFQSHKPNKTKPNRPVSLRSKYKTLSAFLTWLVKYSKRKKLELIIPEHEIEEIKYRCKSPNVIGREQRASKRRALTEEQVKTLRETISSPVIANIFDIGLNLGLRRIEYERIKLEHYHPDENFIDIIGKGYKIRDISLTEEMKDLIYYQLSLRKLTKVDHNYLFFHPRNKLRLRGYAVNQIYLELSEKTGVPFNAHELRYTMDALMFKKGVPFNLIAQRLGHSGHLTLHYARENIDLRVQVLEKLVGVL